MPKLKTRRSIAKRFRLTGKGKIKRSHAFRSHLLSGRSRNRKRRLRRSDLVNPADDRRIRSLIGG